MVRMIDLVAYLTNGLPDVLAVSDRNVDLGIHSLSSDIALSLPYDDSATVLVGVLLAWSRTGIAWPGQILGLSRLNKRDGCQDADHESSDKHWRGGSWMVRLIELIADLPYALPSVLAVGDRQKDISIEGLTDDPALRLSDMHCEAVIPCARVAGREDGVAGCPRRSIGAC